MKTFFGQWLVAFVVAFMGNLLIDKQLLHLKDTAMDHLISMLITASIMALVLWLMRVAASKTKST